MLGLIAFGVAAAGAPVCAGTPLPAAVEHYAVLTRTQDVAALGALFGRTGVLVGPGGAPLTGAGEIARFLGGFAGYHVAEERLTVASMTPAGADWRAAGSFAQRGTVPDGTPYATSGVWTSRWTCTRAGWRIVRMATGAGETAR